MNAASAGVRGVVRALALGAVLLAPAGSLSAQPAPQPADLAVERHPVAVMAVHDAGLALPGGAEAVVSVARAIAWLVEPAASAPGRPDAPVAPGVVERIAEAARARRAFVVTLWGATHDGQPVWEWQVTPSAPAGEVGNGVRDGVGDGVEAWAARAAAHAAALPETRRAALPMVEILLDLNAARRVDPEGASSGGLARTLRAWRASQARAIAVRVARRDHAAPLPTVVEIDMTYESRREPPGVVRHARVTPELELAAHVAASPPGTAWVAVVPVDAARWSERVARPWKGVELDPMSEARVLRLDALLADMGVIVGIPRTGNAPEPAAEGGELGAGSTGVAPSQADLVALLPLARGRAGSSVLSDIRAMLTRAGGAPVFNAADRVGTATLAPGFALEWTMAGPGFGHTLALSFAQGAAVRGAAAAE